MAPQTNSAVGHRRTRPHPTILHLLGLDHDQLTFCHNGIKRWLTSVHVTVIRDVLA